MNQGSIESKNSERKRGRSEERRKDEGGLESWWPFIVSSAGNPSSSVQYMLHEPRTPWLLLQ